MCKVLQGKKSWRDRGGGQIKITSLPNERQPNKKNIEGVAYI